MFQEVSVEIGGRVLKFETGKIARQANGSVVARYGDTVVLATACMDSRPRDPRTLAAGALIGSRTRG